MRYQVYLISSIWPHTVNTILFFCKENAKDPSKGYIKIYHWTGFLEIQRTSCRQIQIRLTRLSLSMPKHTAKDDFLAQFLCLNIPCRILLWSPARTSSIGGWTAEDSCSARGCRCPAGSAPPSRSCAWDRRFVSQSSGGWCSCNRSPTLDLFRRDYAQGSVHASGRTMNCALVFIYQNSPKETHWSYARSDILSLLYFGWMKTRLIRSSTYCECYK